jgi:hypothetical protein
MAIPYFANLCTRSGFSLVSNGSNVRSNWTTHTLACSRRIMKRKKKIIVSVNHLVPSVPHYCIDSNLILAQPSYFHRNQLGELLVADLIGSAIVAVSFLNCTSAMLTSDGLSPGRVMVTASIMATSLCLKMLFACQPQMLIPMSLNKY